MERIIDKFSLYELFAYFIPGLLLVLSSLFFCNYVGIDLRFVNIDNNLVINTLSIIIYSYFAGIVLHEISEIIQKGLKFIWGGFPSERFLTKNNKIIPSDKEIKQYVELAKDKFQLDIDKENPKDNDLLFHRIRESIKSDGSYSSIEALNHNYGMYRTLLALVFLYGTFFISLYLIVYKNPIYLNLFIFFSFICLVLARRTKRFGETFVKRTIRAGYSKYNNEKTGS